MKQGKPNRAVKSYAVNIVNEIRSDIRKVNSQTLPAVDLAEVLRIDPIVVEPHGHDVEYDEEDLIFLIDPDSIKKGQLVTLGRDSSGQPIVMGIADGNSQDPFDDPEAAALKDSFVELEANTKTFKAPVYDLSELPEDASYNQDNDIKFVKSENTFYAWDADTGTWNQTSLGTGMFVDQTGDNMTGDLVMGSGTKITLPDAPVNPTDATNKAYVDSVVGSPVLSTVTVTTNYVVSASDALVLVDSSSNPVTVTLPATHTVGKVYRVKDKMGTALSNAITVQTADADTIDGAVSFIFTVTRQSVTFVSDGSNWFVI